MFRPHTHQLKPVAKRRCRGFESLPFLFTNKRYNNTRWEFTLRAVIPMKFFPSTLAARIRLGVFVCILAAVSYTFKAQVFASRAGYSPREGDIIFQSLPHEELVDAIEGVTHSPYSHCGVVLLRENRWVVVEAIFDVHETPLLQWMQRGRKAGVAIYRLEPKYTAAIPEFKKRLISFEGLPYDYDYAMSDDAIYCSELAYKAFQKATGEEMGRLEKLGDLDWKPFERFIQSVQGKLPLDRLMITPASLSRAKQIHEVYRVGI